MVGIWYRIIGIIVSITVVISLWSGFFLVTPTHAANLYSRSITVTNTGTSVTNWAFNFTVNTQALITAAKMRTDCGDIRVTDASYFSLPYWVDSGCNTPTTLIWVRALALPLGTSTLNFEYGDLTLTTQSNAPAVMDKYEDMQTAPSCVVTGNTANTLYDSTNKRLQLTSAAASQSGSCTYTLTPSNGFYARFNFQSGGGNGADSMWVFGYNATGPGAAEDMVDGGYHFTFDEYQTRSCYTKSTIDNGAGISCSTQTTIANNAVHKGEIYFSGLNGIILYDGVQIINANDSIANSKTGTKFGFAARTGGQFNNHFILLSSFTRYTPTITAVVGAEAAINFTLSLAIKDVSDTAFVNSCDLGNASVTALSQCAYRLKIGTNIANGYLVFVQTSGNLANGVKFITNAAGGTGGTGGTLINATTTGAEGYGVLITPGSLTEGGTFTRPVAYNAGAVNSTTFTPTIPTLILTATSANYPSTGSDLVYSVLVTHNLNISQGTVGGSYAQSITYTVVPNF